MSSDNYAVDDSFLFFRGRARLRRPFLGGRRTRLGSPIRIARARRFFGGSTVHPALRRKSIASTRACTHKPTAKCGLTPPNVRYWGESGHGPVLSVCSVMTHSGHAPSLYGLEDG